MAARKHTHTTEADVFFERCSGPILMDRALVDAWIDGPSSLAEYRPPAGGNMNLRDYLATEEEALPDWLSRFRSGDGFPEADFFRSQTVYYPGSGGDGQPVAAFNAARAAHCFIYVDNGVRLETIKSELADPEQEFRGYRSLSQVELGAGRIPGTGLLAVLERSEGFDDRRGDTRIAILFLEGDGFEVFEALFGSQTSMPAPYCIVLQDHGFGGNGLERFGRGGRLERIARRKGIFSKYLLVADNTKPWDGYSRCENVAPERGGIAHGGSTHERFLFRHSVR